MKDEPITIVEELYSSVNYLKAHQTTIMNWEFSIQKHCWNPCVFWRQTKALNWRYHCNIESRAMFRLTYIQETLKCTYMPWNYWQKSLSAMMSCKGENENWKAIKPVWIMGHNLKGGLRWNGSSESMVNRVNLVPPATEVREHTDLLQLREGLSIIVILPEIIRKA